MKMDSDPFFDPRPVVAALFLLCRHAMLRQRQYMETFGMSHISLERVDLDFAGSSSYLSAPRV